MGVSLRLKWVIGVMSRLRRLLCITAMSFLPLFSAVPGDGAVGERVRSDLQSSYLVSSSVIGSAGCAGAGLHYQTIGTMGQSSPIGEGMAAGKALYTGFWGGVWTPAPVRVNLVVECPPDISLMPSCTDAIHLVLPGFKIANHSSVSLCVEYQLSSIGPGTLVDNGHPASISGVTPPLASGQSISPPPAALDVPAAKENLMKYVEYCWSQYVVYQFSPTGSPDVEDSCATHVKYVIPPTEVLTVDLQARALDDCVELVWKVERDYEIEGFRLYRRGEVGADVPINPDQLIPHGVKKYVDGDIHGGETYWYRLGVVRKDNSEDFSNAVMVRTKVPLLGLHQNVPNPFNPMTTISVALPTRAMVVLSVFNVKGELIRTLVDGVLDEGLSEVIWDGKNGQGDLVGAGVYVCKLKVGEKELVRKMVLLR